MRTHLAGICAALTLAGCAVAVPEGRFACSTAAQCPTGWACTAGFCYSSTDAAAVDAGPADIGIDVSVVADGGPDAARSDLGSDLGVPGRWCDAGGCDDAVEVRAGGSHSCARRMSGAVFCWGRNADGQVGDGTTTDRNTPVAVVGLPDAVEVAGGGSFTCARRTASTVACWGTNASGQLGNGSTVASATPSVVMGLSDAVQISTSGTDHACVLQAGGTVVCWGNNGLGMLGDGTTTMRTVPTRVTGLTDAVEVAAGPGHTCARRAAGSVVCWGDNSLGQLGTGTTAPSLTPVPVAGLVDAVEIAAGYTHTCARRTSGSVVCWGQNDLGELGDGVVTHSGACGGTDCALTPVTVSGLSDAVQLSATAHTCARRATGAIVCWGTNLTGELGDGVPTHSTCAMGYDCSYMPVTVVGVLDAVDVSAGGSHTCARRATGVVIGWGANTFGELGDGVTTHSTCMAADCSRTPVTVQAP